MTGLGHKRASGGGLACKPYHTAHEPNSAARCVANDTGGSQTAERTERRREKGKPSKSQRTAQTTTWIAHESRSSRRAASAARSTGSPCSRRCQPTPAFIEKSDKDACAREQSRHTSHWFWRNRGLEWVSRQRNGRTVQTQGERRTAWCKTKQRQSQRRSRQVYRLVGTEDEILRHVEMLQSEDGNE